MWKILKETKAPQAKCFFFQWESPTKYNDSSGFSSKQIVFRRIYLLRF